MEVDEINIPPSIAGPSGAALERLPPGWSAERTPDGALCLRRTPEAHYRLWAIHQLAAVLWNGMLVCFVVGAYNPHAELEGYGPGWGLLNLWPFVLIGLMFAWGAAWSWWGWDAWWVYPNRIEYRSGWRFLRHAKNRSYRNGVLELRQYCGEDDPYWDLIFKCPGGWLNRGLIESTRCERNHTGAQLRALGEQISQESGWPLELRPLQP